MSTDILGQTAQLMVGYAPKYIITYLKLRDVSANRFNAPRYISAELRVFGFLKPVYLAGQERCASHVMSVKCIHGCRMNVYQDFMVLGSRFFYLFQFQNIG
jgi:hypothetical protein